MFALVKPDEPSPADSVAAGPSRAEPTAEPDAGVPETVEDAATDCENATSDFRKTEDDFRNAAEGFDYSTDEYSDDENVYDDVIGSYMGKRNIVTSSSDDTADSFFTNKTIIEYLNLKFIDNNCRSAGLTNIFDEHTLSQAQLEFKSFEKWFLDIQKYVADKIRNHHLCLPLFCHLYLNLYSEKEHQNFISFLNVFKHLFVCSKGVIFLRELKNVVDLNNLPPFLSLFRKNKTVFTTTPEFLSKLYHFFQRHFLLKSVFQEWFDINYSTNLDPLVILNSYFINSPQINDSIKKNVSNDGLSKDVSNTKENPSNHSETNLLNGEQKLGSKISNDINSNESSFGDSDDSASKTSFSDEEFLMRKFYKNKLNPTGFLSFKSTCHLKSLNTTKIEPINIDDDPYFSTTRQIFLTNCSKLSCCILTTDCKYLAAGSLDSLIYLWDRSNTCIEIDKNGKLDESDSTPSNKSNSFKENLDKSTATILRGHGGSVFDVSEISSSKILLSASIDKTFRIWDLDSKLCLEVYDGHEHKIWCVSACPNSLQVVTGSSDGNGCLWFLDYKRPLRIFTGHVDDVLVVQIHPCQVILATGSADKTVRLFELVSGACQRLFVGHKDYISCIEFCPENPSIFASASGSGEIIVWDMPTGDVLWTIKVPGGLLSSIVWSTRNDDIILASLSTGVILKCHTNENYNDESKKVKGYTTKYCRLLSMCVFDNELYAIGIPGQFSLQKRSASAPLRRFTNTVENESFVQQKLRGSKKAPLPFKMFFEKHILKNGDLVKPILDSTDIKNQLTIDPNDTTLLTPDFFQMDVQNLPFKVTPDEVAKLNSQHILSDIKSIKKPSGRTKSTQKNTSRTSAAKSGKIPNILSASSSTSQMSNQQQSDINQSSNIVNLQLLKLQSCNEPSLIHPGIKKNVQLQSNGEISNLQCSNTKINTGTDQQRPKLKPVSRTRSTKLPSMKSGFQNEQGMHNFAEGNIRVASPRALKQTLYQHIRPNTLMSKLSVQQKLSQNVTSIRLGNVNVSQTQQFDFNTQHLSKPSLLSSAAGMPIRLSIRPQNTVVENQSPTGEYGQLSATSVASLLHSNPEMLSCGQPMNSHITKSQSTTQPSDNSKSNLLTESQENKKL